MSGHRWRRIGAIIALIAAPAAKTRISTAVDPSSFVCRQNSSRKKRSMSMYSSTCGGKCADISRWTRARTSVSPPCRSMISWMASPSRCESGTNYRSICQTRISSRLSRGNCVERHGPIIRQSSKREKTFYFIESSDPTVRSTVYGRMFVEEEEIAGVILFALDNASFRILCTRETISVHKQLWDI